MAVLGSIIQEMTRTVKLMPLPHLFYVANALILLFRH